MNAAFLLMTTACLSAGQVPAPPTLPPPAPAACASCGYCGGASCGGGACNGYVDVGGSESFAQRLRSHLRGLFTHDGDSQTGRKAPYGDPRKGTEAGGCHIFQSPAQRAQGWDDFYFIFCRWPEQ